MVLPLACIVLLCSRPSAPQRVLWAAGLSLVRPYPLWPMAAGSPWRLFVDGTAGAKQASAASAVMYDHAGFVVCARARVLGGQVDSCDAEYAALSLGLRLAAENGHEPVLVHSDARIVVDGMRGRSTPRRRKAKCESAQALARSIEGVEYRHVPRTHNRCADELARCCARAAGFIVSAQLCEAAAARRPELVTRLLTEARHDGLVLTRDAWISVIGACAVETTPERALAVAEHASHALGTGGRAATARELLAAAQTGAWEHAPRDVDVAHSAAVAMAELSSERGAAVLPVPFPWSSEARLDALSVSSHAGGVSRIRFDG